MKYRTGVKFFEKDSVAYLTGVDSVEKMNKRKLLQKLISGSKNVKFTEATTIAEIFGFVLDRISGSHHIYLHPDIPELVNLQNVKGKAKPYQIKQLLKIIEKYNLNMEDDK